MKRACLFLFVIALFSSCKLNKEAEKVVIKDYFITNEFLAQLYDLDQKAEIEQKFRKQKLKITDEVAPWLKMVKMEYDTTTMDPAKMFAKLKLSGYVRELEFNKRITERSR